MITKENSGYNNSININFDTASGEYIAIVESDDYDHTNMFESFYGIGKGDHLDVIKSSYYHSKSEEQNEKTRKSNNRNFFKVIML